MKKQLAKEPIARQQDQREASKLLEDLDFGRDLRLDDDADDQPSGLSTDDLTGWAGAPVSLDAPVENENTAPTLDEATLTRLREALATTGQLEAFDRLWADPQVGEEFQARLVAKRMEIELQQKRSLTAKDVTEVFSDFSETEGDQAKMKERSFKLEKTETFNE
ncbi:hypothetical protein SCOR_27320 [Sulfidibacter corallicola]